MCSKQTVIVWLGVLASGVAMAAVAPGEPPVVAAVAPVRMVKSGEAGLREAKALAVDPTSREAVRAFYNTHYTGSSGAAIGWSGNVGACNAGTTAAAFRNGVATRINFYRAMAGVPAGITLDSTYNSGAQAAALMMSANGMLSHDPPTSWSCYTSAGDTGAQNANLTLSVNGPGAIDNYLEDFGSSNGAVGHRRWILHPQTQTMGTGDIPEGTGAGAYAAANALWVFDSHLFEVRPATRQTFIAWPPAGYVPYPVVWPRWSISHPTADFRGASVTVMSKGAAIPVTLHPVVNGYGENTLVWYPSLLDPSHPYDWPKPAADTDYLVTVAGVVMGGATQTVRYTVTVFDPAVAGGPWSGAADLGGGWRWLSWFGSFNVSSEPWIYHAQHGWLYTLGTSVSNMWFWDVEMGAPWWTSDTLYPYLYRSTDASWLWYLLGTDDPRWMVNLSTGGWESQ
jgi:uncharacterized protein YkwD